MASVTPLVYDTTTGLARGRTASDTVSLTTTDITTALGYTPANPATFVSSFKNKLINPDFDFWQRGTTGSGNAYLADRWIAFSGGSTVAVSQQAFAVGQSSVPNNPAYFHRCVVTSVAGAGNFVIQVQRVENVGTLAGSSVTVSFWAKSDANRNMSVNFAQAFGTGGSPSSQVEVNGQTVSLTTAWQYFKLTFSLPSISGKTLGTNGDSFLQLRFWFDAGSNYNALSNNLGQQSGTFDIAQVQLETGSTATPFEVRPTGLELLLCQRYYEKSYDVITAPGAIGVPGYAQFNIGGLPSSTYVATSVVAYCQPKRATPTVTTLSYSTGATGKFRDASNAADVTTSVAGGSRNLTITATAAAANTSINILGHWTADAEL